MNKARLSQKNSDWNFNCIRPIYILGDSNLARIGSFQNDDIEIDSFPGATFDHFQEVMSKAPVQPRVELVVLSVGLNNREQDPHHTSIKQLRRVYHLAIEKFPNARIYVALVNFSAQLPWTQTRSLNIINNFICSHYPHLRNLPLSDCPTAQAILKHWCDQLHIEINVSYYHYLGLPSVDALAGAAEDGANTRVLGMGGEFSLGSSSNILNLSTRFCPDGAQAELLNRGLTFIPKPNHLDKNQLRGDLYVYHRQIKLADYFRDSEGDRVAFANPSTWEPKWDQLSTEVQELVRLDVACLNDFTPGCLDYGDQKNKWTEVINSLRDNPHIIIKPADKGSKIVIMDKNQYLFEANRQLSNTTYYKPIPNSLGNDTAAKVRSIIHALHIDRYISAKHGDFLLGPQVPRERQFYLFS